MRFLSSDSKSKASLLGKVCFSVCLMAARRWADAGVVLAGRRAKVRLVKSTGSAMGSDLGTGVGSLIGVIK